MSALALVLGATVGLGLMIVVAGLRGAIVPRVSHRVFTRARIRTGLVAVAACAVALALTGWPVLALLVAAGVFALPRMMTGLRRRAAAERSEAVAQWIEMLRDTMAGAAGLEEAIAVSARRPPPPIATEVSRLARRLEHHTLPAALRVFAVEIRDPAADLLAAALITAATNETRDLGRVLAALVDATRAQVQMRESVDAGRAQVRSATRLVLAITATFMIAMLVFSRDYLVPYATVEGQLWLAVVGGVFTLSLMLLLRLDRIDLPVAPLVADPSATTDATTRWDGA